MIGKLKGIVDSIELDSAIIDINGVGYLIYASNQTLKTLNVDEATILNIETHVREDQITLFAFATVREKETFKILLKVNGVGTRMALAILSVLSPEQLAQSIAMQETTMLTQANGVGKKLATRIITELKGKFEFDISQESSFQVQNSSDPAIEDAVSALINLGYNRVKALNAIQKISAEQDNFKVGDLIKMGLKELVNDR